MTKLTRRLLFAVACCAWIVSHDAGAQEWTRFRGPNGSGVSDAKTVPTQWTDEDYNWKTELPGEGLSSPVLWGDKLFVTAADSD
ncbi:MAG: PQQ-binding-like beta-propeller repeat protein, partial [Planctomycetales bacterium]